MHARAWSLGLRLDKLEAQALGPLKLWTRLQGLRLGLGFSELWAWACTSLLEAHQKSNLAKSWLRLLMITIIVWSLNNFDVLRSLVIGWKLVLLVLMIVYGCCGHHHGRWGGWGSLNKISKAWKKKSLKGLPSNIVIVMVVVVAIVAVVVVVVINSHGSGSSWKELRAFEQTEINLNHNQDRWLQLQQWPQQWPQPQPQLQQPLW